jgi:hypothetical protein
MENNLPDNTQNAVIQTDKNNEMEVNTQELLEQSPEVYLEFQKIEIAKMNIQKLVEQSRAKSQKEIIETICSTAKEIMNAIHASEKERITKIFTQSMVREAGRFVIVLAIIIAISWLAYIKIIPSEVLVPVLTLIVGSYVASRVTSRE